MRRAALAALALLLVVLAALGLRGPRAASEIEVSGARAGSTRDAPAAATDDHRASAPGGAPERAAETRDRDGDAGARAGLTYEEQVKLPREARWRARLDDTRRALVEKMRYPDRSQPLGPLTDQLLPNHVEPTLRPLRTDAPSKVAIRQTQSRFFVAPGDEVVLGVDAVSDGVAVPVELRGGSLVRLETADPSKGTVVADIAFSAAEGRSVARLVPPEGRLAGFTGTLLARVDARAAGEQAELTFRLVYCAPPPARFTGGARDALEAGSVAIYVGVEVTRAGFYDLKARLYDAEGRPIALLREQLRLAPGDREVRMLAYGKLLRDEGAIAPYELRDVEGHRQDVDHFPDREVMPVWAGGHRTARYDAAALTDAPFEDPARRKHLAELDREAREGPPPAPPQGTPGAAPGAPAPSR